MQDLQEGKELLVLGSTLPLGEHFEVVHTI